MGNVSASQCSCIRRETGAHKPFTLGDPDTSLSSPTADHPVKLAESDKSPSTSSKTGTMYCGGVTVVTDTSCHESDVSVSVTCRGSVNGKKWSFQLHNITGGIADDELANVVESVRNAIGSTLHTGSHSRSSQQSPITSYNKPCKILEAQDDTAISVVSRDSGLPPDTEHLSLPPSSYHSSSTKHSFSGQYVMLQTLADESASHQEECPSPPAHTAAVDQLTPGGEIAETTASPPVTHSQQPLGHEEPAQYICSQCKRKAKQSSSRQEKAGGHQQSHRQHRTRTNKQSLTLTNVSQDKVENYLEYRFASISDKEQLDAKSMTFSEYVGDRNDDPREQRRQHCAQQRTQHRCQSADKSPAPENHA